MMDTDHLKPNNTEHKPSISYLDPRTPTGSIIRIKNQHDTSYIASASPKIKEKCNNIRPKSMKPTIRSMVLFVSLCITGLLVSFMHRFARAQMALFYPSAFLWIISATITAYYEVDFVAFKLTIISFRGLAISIAMFITILCDFCRTFLTPDPEPIFTMILGNICWIYAVMYLLFCADSTPRILNFIRFLGPLLILSQTLWEALNQYIWNPDDDYTLFNAFHGSMTLNGIELTSRIQIVWYGCTFFLAVPRDRKRQYFIMLDDRILTKTLLPFRNIAITATTFCYRRCNIKTISIFRIITALGTIDAALYLFVLSYYPLDSSNIAIVIAIGISMVLGAILFILFAILVSNYFQSYMMKELLVQFRGNMLIAAIIIFIYVAIQKIIWKDKDSINLPFILQTILNNSIFVLTVIAVWIRDAMNILYPTYFVVYFGILLSLISVWNIMLLSLGRESTEYPLWFLLLERQAYSQVILIWYLSIYYVLRDRNGHYFVLIRKRRETKELWGDPPDRYLSVTDYDIDTSSEFINTSRKPTRSQLDTLNSTLHDTNDNDRL